LPSLLQLLPPQKSSTGPTSAAYLLYFGTVQTALLPSPSFGGEEKDKAAQNENAMPSKHQQYSRNTEQRHHHSTHILD